LVDNRDGFGWWGDGSKIHFGNCLAQSKNLLPYFLPELQQLCKFSCWQYWKPHTCLPRRRLQKFSLEMENTNWLNLIYFCYLFFHPCDFGKQEKSNLETNKSYFVKLSHSLLISLFLSLSVSIWLCIPHLSISFFNVIGLDWCLSFIN
jgi:hypothetical protein